MLTPGSVWRVFHLQVYVWEAFELRYIRELAWIKTKTYGKLRNLQTLNTVTHTYLGYEYTCKD